MTAKQQMIETIQLSIEKEQNNLAAISYTGHLEEALDKIKSLNLMKCEKILRLIIKAGIKNVFPSDYPYFAEEI